MRRNDRLITLKVPKALKEKLEDESKHKGITLSELIRLRVSNNTQNCNNEDVPTLPLTGTKQLELKRCQRCNGIFMPFRAGQLYCCNGCGCNNTCTCGAIDNQRILIV